MPNMQGGQGSGGSSASAAAMATETVEVAETPSRTISRRDRFTPGNAGRTNSKSSKRAANPATIR